MLKNLYNFLIQQFEWNIFEIRYLYKTGYMESTIEGSRQLSYYSHNIVWIIIIL